MIVSFADKRAEQIWRREYVKDVSKEICRVAYRKLTMIDKAKTLGDLAAVPGNHFEKLRGDRKGQISIRINDQWRICFEWGARGALHVEITDYH